MIRIFITLSTLFLVNSVYGSDLDRERIEELIQLESKRIKLLEEQVSGGGETELLSDILFNLSESHLQKFTLLFNLKRLQNPDAPFEELDLTVENREKRKASDILKRIVKFFPDTVGVTDKAIYADSQIERALGDDKKFLSLLKQITEDFPKGEYASKAYLDLGEYYESKSDYEFAVNFYKKGLGSEKDQTFFRLQNKIGLSYFLLEKDREAYQTFYNALKILKEQDTDQDYDGVGDSIAAGFARAYSILTEKDYKVLRISGKRFDQLAKEVAPNIFVYTKMLKEGTKRLSVKKRNQEALFSSLKWLELEKNIKDRIDAVYKTFDLWRKSGSKEVLIGFPENIFSTVEFFDTSIFSDKNKMIKTYRDTEVISRYYLTQIDKKNRNTNNAKIIDHLIAGYEGYKRIYPKSKFINDLNLNYAELSFKRKDFLKAGYGFYQLSKNSKSKKDKVEMLDASVKSYISSLESKDLDTRLERLETRAGLRKSAKDYLALNPRGPTAETIAFNYAQSYYRERNFEVAALNFYKFLKMFPASERNSDASLLLLDSVDQGNDKKDLISYGNRILKESLVKSSETQNQIRNIIEETMIAESRKGGAGRNTSLLNLASKYKGTSFGDRALYEAFLDLKAKRDPKAFDVGESLLSKHSASKYAKIAVTEMAKIAVLTAELDRAAKYFLFFAERYPQDSDSKAFLNQAADIYIDMNKFDLAERAYKSLGNYEKVAEMQLKQGNWNDLATTCKRSNSSLRYYYCGVAQYFLSQTDAARQNLSKALQSLQGEQSSAAQYFLALLKYKNYESLRMKPGNEAEVIGQKMQSLTGLQSVISEISQGGHPKWGLAGQYLMGRTHKDFKAFILSTPLPPRLPASQESAIKQQIKAQAAPYAKSSKEFFQSCRMGAEKYKLFNPASLSCSSNRKSFDEESLVVSSNSDSKTVSNPSISQIRRKLYKSPRDIQLYLALSNELLKVKAGGEASAVLNRALEIDSNNAELKALLGVAQVLLGNDQLAYETFKQARAKNSREPHALHGLFHLYKKYRFKNSLKEIQALLSSAKGSSIFNDRFYSQN
jgi:outer membrane protein assembly factor BamD (BamD/ComL family)